MGDGHRARRVRPRMTVTNPLVEDLESSGQGPWRTQDNKQLAADTCMPSPSHISFLA